MKLDYATLISPFPLYLPNIGNIKSPLLKEIWNPCVTYGRYNMYLSLLLTDLKNYCEKINPQMSEWFQELSDETKSLFNMFDIISADKELQEQYKNALSFFFEENIFWNNNCHAYFVYTSVNEDGAITPIGIINKDIWEEVCDVILQLNNVSRKDTTEKLKFKSKLAQEVWEMTHPKENEENKNKDMELPNIISSVAAKDESLNIINIWDLTVYQLYDQFQRQQGNSYYEISAMRMSAWGDENNKFDGGSWYKNIHET